MKLQSSVVKKCDTQLDRSVNPLASSSHPLSESPIFAVQCKDPPGIVVSFGLVISSSTGPGHQAASEYSANLSFNEGLGPTGLHLILTHASAFFSFSAVFNLLNYSNLKSEVYQFLAMLVKNILVNAN